MILTNTSRYAMDDVRKIAKFCLRDIEGVKVAVNVKNSKYAYAGRAYDYVPGVSPLRGKADKLIVVRIGSPDKFPKDNMIESRKWVRMKEGETFDPNFVRFTMTRDADGKLGGYHSKLIVAKHPYGGKSSPHIVMNDWKEGLVSLLAHEARHIWQYVTGAVRSEVDAESYAWTRLQEYRSFGC